MATKSALEQVSEKYEEAKRKANAILSDPQHLMTDLVIARAEQYTWSHALTILQSCRGEFVG